MTHKRGASLQFKLTIGLVVIVMVPLAVSYFLIDQIGKVAANFAAGEADTHVVVMDKALGVYRDLFVTTKNYQAEVADRLAHRPDLSRSIRTRTSTSCSPTRCAASPCCAPTARSSRRRSVRRPDRAGATRCSTSRSAPSVRRCD